MNEGEKRSDCIFSTALENVVETRGSGYYVKWKGTKRTTLYRSLRVQNGFRFISSTQKYVYA